MVYLLSTVLYTFFKALELILLIYIITSWLPINRNIKNTIYTITAPMLQPIRYLLSKSIFNTKVTDFSPLIVFVILSFLQTLFYNK